MRYGNNAWTKLFIYDDIVDFIDYICTPTHLLDGYISANQSFILHY